MKSTIIVFTSDHGEMAGAHEGQIEKWHEAYQETIDVPAIVSSPLVNPDADALREPNVHSTHVDCVPTLLGLAGFDANAQTTLARVIQGLDVQPLAGADLSTLLLSPNAKPEHDGVLFDADDPITKPLDTNYTPAQYDYDQQSTESFAAEGVLESSGAIVQPNYMHSYFQLPWRSCSNTWTSIPTATQSNPRNGNCTTSTKPPTRIATCSHGAMVNPSCWARRVESLGLDVAGAARTTSP